MQEPIRIELPTLFEMKTVNTYLFLGEEPTLVDCGEKTDASWEALQNGLAEHGLKITDLKRIVITHAHVDHMGMANKVAQHSGAKVWVSDFVYDWAVDFRKMWNRRSQLMLSFLEDHLGDLDEGSSFLKNISGLFNQIHLVWDPIPAEKLHRFSLDDHLILGDQKWEVHYFPGHSITQTCFYQPESKFFLAADMLLKRTPAPVIDVDPSDPQKRANSLAQMLESYDRLAKVDITKVFPGHYEPFSEVSTTIKNQVERIHFRKNQCLDFIKEGHNTLKTLFERMYKNYWNLAALAMLVGYLDILIDEGQVKKQKVDGKYLYQPVNQVVSEVDIN